MSDSDSDDYLSKFELYEEALAAAKDDIKKINDISKTDSDVIRRVVNDNLSYDPDEALTEEVIVDLQDTMISELMEEIKQMKEKEEEELKKAEQRLAYGKSLSGRLGSHALVPSERELIETISIMSSKMAQKKQRSKKQSKKRSKKSKKRSKKSKKRSKKSKRQSKKR